MVAEESFSHAVGSPGALGLRQSTAGPRAFRCVGVEGVC